jgi:hypothetical protein
MTELLHVYGHAYPHDDVVIVGTAERLLFLARILEVASRGSQNAPNAAGNFTADGEGYTVRVRCVDAPTMDALPLPYTDDAFETPGDDPRWAALMELAR